MRFLIIIVAFFLIGALFIISNNNLEMYKKENIEKFSQLYMNWFTNILSNIQKITGEAVRLNWLSNTTNS
jgi:predicted negative regulator of RcsB-dependent stress response